MNHQQTLIEDCLKQEPVGETKTFTWFATPMGIAAYSSSLDACCDEIFELAIREGKDIAIDLSREEKESYLLSQGLALLFYS